jgi:hypothetical protein
MTIYPLYCPTSPCEALVCSTRAHRVAVCREKGCPHRWQREAAEDRGEFELMKAIGQIKEGT